MGLKAIFTMHITIQILPAPALLQLSEAGNQHNETVFQILQGTIYTLIKQVDIISRYEDSLSDLHYVYSFSFPVELLKAL